MERALVHDLPAVHALHLAELLKRWNLPQEALFHGLGLDREALADPAARMSLDVVERLVARARELTGGAPLGLYLGMQMRASGHGYVGFAAMTSATVREALDLAVRFAPTRTTAIQLRLVDEGSTAALVIDERADFGTARDVVISAIAIGLWQMACALTERELGGRLDFAFAEPPNWSFSTDMRQNVRFGQPCNRLVFEPSLLDLELAPADPAARRLALDQCETALSSLERAASSPYADRVLRLVARDDGIAAASIDDVAARLHVSARTLKRRLATEGKDYSTLLAEARRDKALLLLRTTDLPIEAVAERVGYSDVANFTRAFRRWTGTTPSAARRQATQR
ncbi:MAG: AraC family transcriptional regulator [Polyangiaceae bacterium]|nr:AraC family transcriptional regulator [Polyangiaceae bacterium]